MTDPRTPRTDGTPRQHTRRHTFRVPDEVHTPAKARAAKRSETVTDVVVRALERYADPARQPCKCCGL